jgi:uncharacterized membrane protein
MGNELTKPWWLSKTIFAALGILAVAILSLFGFNTAASDSADIADSIERAVYVVLSLVAIYGRITAKQRISR